MGRRGCSPAFDTSHALVMEPGATGRNEVKVCRSPSRANPEKTTVLRVVLGGYFLPQWLFDHPAPGAVLMDGNDSMLLDVAVPFFWQVSRPRVITQVYFEFFSYLDP